VGVRDAAILIGRPYSTKECAICQPVRWTRMSSGVLLDFNSLFDRSVEEPRSVRDSPDDWPA